MVSVVTTQTDFSAGQVDIAAKRDQKNPLLLAGARQASNVRILNSKGMTNRPGRRALFLALGRVEEVLMAPGSTWFIAFGAGTLKVFDSTGTQVFTALGLPWSLATVKNVVWVRFDKSIYITVLFGVGQASILTWDGVTTWTLTGYGENLLSSGHKQTPFYRIFKKGATLTPSATTGSITITFSEAYLVAAMIGTFLRYNGSQMIITGVTSPTVGTATVIERLLGAYIVTFTATINATWNVGDVCTGQTSGARGQITSFPSATSAVFLMLNNAVFIGTSGDHEMVTGPAGSFQIAEGATSVVATTPPASPNWDEEVINAFRGFPQSVFVDQNRLGFCNFPALPAAIVWSEVANFTNLEPGTLPTDPIFELAPENAQVFHVVPGPEASEFVFCSNNLWYIPISETNPLRPGSVAFRRVSSDGCLNVQPRAVQEAIIYLRPGGVSALYAFGAANRPYKTEDLTELRGQLLIDPIAIAIPTEEGDFPERYAYILNGDGTVVVGKYTIDPQGKVQGLTGWLPWSSPAGVISWIAALGSDVILTTSYTPNGITAVSVVEQLDASRYLDGSQLYNTQPTGLPIPVGKGPLWWLAGGSVDLMDGPLGTRMMGTYLVDANGFIIPQGNGGEDLTSVNLRVGQAWTARLEPFIPPMPPGQDVDQRMHARRVSRVEIYVKDSSGFLMQRLYSGQTGPLLPAPGTVMSERRISTWNQGEDPTQPPPLREQAYHDRPLGRSHDPRWAFVKDTPGPVTVLEISTEVTV